MIHEHIELTRPAEKVVQVLLNRPRQFNALNQKMIQELFDTIEAFEDSNDDFLILAGAGRAFCFGADFQEFQNKQALPQMLDLFQSLILKLYHTPKITVACLNGFTTGAGLDLALACDFRIAAEKIKLAEAYISMGLVPDGGGTFFLPRLIGTGRALALLLTGEAVTAEEAIQLGLIHKVHPPGELAQATLQFVVELSQKPKTARQLIKRLVKNPSETLEASLKKERESQLLCFEDSEHLKLAEEFLKKRKKEN